MHFSNRPLPSCPHMVPPLHILVLILCKSLLHHPPESPEKVMNKAPLNTFLYSTVQWFRDSLYKFYIGMSHIVDYEIWYCWFEGIGHELAKHLDALGFQVEKCSDSTLETKMIFCWITWKICLLLFMFLCLSKII